MLDFKKLVSPALLVNPQFITEDGVNKKLSHYNMTEDGLVPVYVETDEVSNEQALDILLGGDEA